MKQRAFIEGMIVSNANPSSFLAKVSYYVVSITRGSTSRIVTCASIYYRGGERMPRSPQAGDRVLLTFYAAGDGSLVADNWRLAEEPLPSRGDLYPRRPGMVPRGRHGMKRIHA